MAADLDRSTNHDRLKSAAAVALFHALLGYAFIAGLGVDVTAKAGETLKLLDIAPEAPPPPPPQLPPLRRSEAPEGAAAPAGLKAEASPVVAPPPRVQIPVPPPVTAAMKAGTGSETSQGASDKPGPGTGSGGEGAGTGSGGSGTGPDGGGVAAPARRIRGELTGRDYPRAAKRANAGGTVVTRYTIGIDGRVTDCAVVKSSGHAILDETSCRLVMQRYRYEPARDEAGRPVVDTVLDRHIWWTEPRRRSRDEWEPDEEDQPEV